MAEALELLQRADLATLTPALTTSQPPRGRAAWPAELADAVEAALAAGAARAPEGVTSADWARVLARHQQEPERSVTQLRTLGPQVQPDEARNEEWLDKLITYLREREPYIPPYGERRGTSQSIGSGQVEKANDQIVAQRQKGAGMHWSLDTSDALAALRTLHLNGGWDAYWPHRQMPSLVTD